MGLVRFALRWPHTFYVVAALIVFLGISAVVTMPTDIFPEIDIPVVTVIWQTAGSPPVASKTKPARPAAVDMAYALTVVRHGGSWLVQSIGAAALQPWPPP